MKWIIFFVVILLLMINCHGNKTGQPIELISDAFEEDSNEEEGEDNGGGEIKHFLFIQEWGGNFKRRYISY
jgi:hypothetical protein